MRVVRGLPAGPLTATGVMVAIALAAVAIGLTELAAAFGLRRILRSTWPLGLAGAISWPSRRSARRIRRGRGGACWLVGLFAIVFGTSLVAFGLSVAPRVAADGRHA